MSLSFPSRDFRHLWSLLRPRLERVHLGYGVEEIILRVVHARRLSHTQMELWPDAASATHVDDHALMGQWLDQIIERLGRHAVVEMRSSERYLPEEAFTSTVLQQAGAHPPAWVSKNKKTNSTFDIRHSKTGIYPAVRPSKLFTPPQHARVIALSPDGPPAWIQWEGREEHVVRGYGPERICGPWWNERRHEGEGDQGGSSNKARRHEGEARDYFVIQTQAGMWLWVFHDCLTNAWYVHGEWT